METTHELLPLKKESWHSKSSWTYVQVCIWTIILFGEAFKYGSDTKFWGYVGTNAEPLCVVFCSFVQCRVLVNFFKFLSVCPSLCPP
jgi:hypothetical protein